MNRASMMMAMMMAMVVMMLMIGNVADAACSGCEGREEKQHFGKCVHVEEVMNGVGILIYDKFYCEWPKGEGQPTCCDAYAATNAAGESFSFGIPDSGDQVFINIRAEDPKGGVGNPIISPDGFSVSYGEPDPDDGSWPEFVGEETGELFYELVSANYGIDYIFCKAGAGLFYIYVVGPAAATTSFTIDCPKDKDISHVDFCGATGEETTPEDCTGEPQECNEVCDSPPGDACAIYGAGQCVNICNPGDGVTCVQNGNYFCKYPYERKVAGTVCRAKQGPCDVPEACDGIDTNCPEDLVEPSTVKCRESAGVCDVEEYCTGNHATCPDDDFVPKGTECRAVNGLCDVAEQCTGESARCPIDAFEPEGKICRVADNSDGSCDVTEYCTGSSRNCPEDGGITEIGAVYKCGRDIYLANGVDEKDLFATDGRTYFTDNSSCNTGANKKTLFWPSPDENVANGCVAGTCPNGKSLSNALFGECIHTADGFFWSCIDKQETTSSNQELCLT